MINKPVYRGEKAFRSSDQKLQCRDCTALATHVARGRRFGRLTTYFCDIHLTQAIQFDEVHDIHMLPEYRVYKYRLGKWHSQIGAGEQTALPL